uniref:Vesicle transport protein USE1 n=1 Tax=Photinus pyralis TaxID=7054 RepID=A0A1Y1MEA7_PHOPY
MVSRCRYSNKYCCRRQFYISTVISLLHNIWDTHILGLRKREPAKKTSSTNDLDDIIDYHQDMQAKIADEMLTLTKNLKEQSELANKIIKKDTEVVGRSSQLTEDNFTKLKSESNKLTEHSKRAWKCWMWIMLLVVLVVFINMVLFMKVMKKKY